MFRLPNYVQAVKDLVVLWEKKAFFYYIHNCNFVSWYVPDFIISLSLSILES